MLIKGKPQQDGISIINTFAPNTRSGKFVKEALLQFTTHTDPHKWTGGDFNTLSPVNKSSRQKLNMNTGANWMLKNN